MAKLSEDAAGTLEVLCAFFSLEPKGGPEYIRTLASRGHVRVLGTDPKDARRRLYSVRDLGRWLKEHPDGRTTQLR